MNNSEPGWAVIGTVDPYHVEGDTTKEKTTDFTWWIYSDEKKAKERLRALKKEGKKARIEQVEGHWDSTKKEATKPE